MSRCDGALVSVFTAFRRCPSSLLCDRHRQTDRQTDRDKERQRQTDRKTDKITTLAYKDFQWLFDDDVSSDYHPSSRNDNITRQTLTELDIYNLTHYTEHLLDTATAKNWLAMLQVMLPCRYTRWRCPGAMVRWLASLPPSEGVRPVCFVIIVGLSVGSERMQGTMKSRNSNQQKQVTKWQLFPSGVAAKIHIVTKKITTLVY